LLGLSLTAFGRATGEEPVDRILASVDEEVITWVDLQRLIRYRGFSVPEVPEERNAFYREVLGQLVNQALIVRETVRTPFIRITDSELEEFFKTWSRRFQSDREREEWLRSQALTQGEILAMMRRQITVNKFIELRFEPFVIVLPDDIQAFYDKEYKPELEREQLPVPEMTLVEETIRQILSVRRTTQQLENWLAATRSRVKVDDLMFRDPPNAPNLPPGLLEQVETTSTPFSKSPDSNR